MYETYYIYTHIHIHGGAQVALVIKELACQCRRYKEIQVRSLEL